MDERWLTSLEPTARFCGLGGEQRFYAEISEIATAGGDNNHKAAALLEPLQQLVHYDAAWIALRDSRTGRHLPLLQDGQTEELLSFFTTDDADAEMQRLGLHRFGWPTLAHRLPVPMEETRAWGEYLLPAGFRDGLSVGLFAQNGPLLGYLILLTSQPMAVTATAAALLHSVNTLIAAAVAPEADDQRGGSS